MSRKLLPYFRWYPSDAEGDDFYSSLTQEARGVYHTCLNRSWMNDGIPADPDALAVICRITRKQLDKVWPRLSQRWRISPRDPLKLVNKRQEEERTAAIEKGEKNKRIGNTNASREKHERELHATRTERDPHNANGLQQARARAESDSVSVSNQPQVDSSFAFSRKPPKPPEMATQERFREWIKPWPRIPNEEKALHAFIFCWTTEEDAAMFACRDRALSSDDAARGVFSNPDKFLYEQKQNGWKGQWPSSKRARTERPTRPAETPMERLDALRWIAENDADETARQSARAEIVRLST